MTATHPLTALLLASTLALAACSGGGDDAANTTMATAGSSGQVTEQPSSDNDSEGDAREPAAPGTDAMATVLVSGIERSIVYTAAIEAECSDPPKAHMGSLATFALITAADRGCAEPALVASRRGSTSYTGQIVAGADTGIATLADIKGKIFCATEPTSTSGWIIPSVMLRAAGLDLDNDITVTYAGGHDAAVLGVYNGECDAGASFVDARTLIEGDYPDVMEKVNVVEISIDIPNDGVQFANSFDPEMKQQIVDALLAIAATEEGAAALNAAYQWDGLEAHGNEFYDPFRQLLDAAGISAADLE